jgi:hypothetical protein
MPSKKPHPFPENRVATKPKATPAPPAKKPVAPRVSKTAKAAKKPAPAADEPQESFARGVYVSVSQLSDETGKTRETVAKKLSGANVAAEGPKRSGADTFRLRDALRALYPEGLTDAADNLSHSDPFKRKAAVDAERGMLELQKEKGELVTLAEVEFEAARAAKIYARALSRIPDVLELNGVSRDAAKAVADSIAEIQTDLADKLGDESYEPPADDAEAANGEPDS